MSNVNLPIGGRNFAVSCAEGEEAHIEMLGRMVEERTRKMSGAQSETRMLLFAALMLADELHDAHRHAPASTSPVEPLVQAPPMPEIDPEIAPQSDNAIVARVNALAERLEKLGAALEQGRASA